MLPWEAEFPLKIVWLYWGRGLEGAGESLAANNPAPIQARFPVPVADRSRRGGGTVRPWNIPLFQERNRGGHELSRKQCRQGSDEAVTFALWEGG